MFPDMSQMAAEKSMTSLTISERAVRMTSYAISSTMASRPFLMTAKVIGSILTSIVTAPSRWQERR